MTFADLLSQKQWDDYATFVSEAPQLYEQELAEELAAEREIRAKIRKEILEPRFEIHSFDRQLEEAEGVLFGGEVVAIDGTVARHRTLSGVRCQIGVVAVNYASDTIRRSFFISEAAFHPGANTAVDFLRNRDPQNRVISDMVVRALLLFRERELALRDQYRGSYKMLHGPLLPFELMTGLGRLRALRSTLSLLRTLVRDDRCFSVVSASTHDDYMTLGLALEPGEYVVEPGRSLGEEIAENPDFMRREKWREDEYSVAMEFLREYGQRIRVGVIRVSERPYVFHAHAANIHTIAGIIARDALLQREKGFPLLLDYADSLCSQYFPAGDFASILTHKMAKDGTFLAHTEERALRSR